MDALEELREVLAENRIVRLVEDSIYSVLPDADGQHHYDRRATIYDLVVSTRLYNSIMWGSSPTDYAAFAREAINACPGVRFLDAACGSMLFTASVYLEGNRQVIAFDQSLAMLRRARQRLTNLSGKVPEHIVLLQADLSDLPFSANIFDTVLCMNVLHQFEHADALIPDLKRLLTGDGQLYLTSLVTSGRFVGDAYLKMLYTMGEFVRPRSKVDLKKIVNRSFDQEVSYQVKGNMAFITTAMFT